MTALFIACILAGMLLAFASVKAQRLSSRLGALITLAILMTLSWFYVALAYAMTDNPGAAPSVLAALFVTTIIALGSIAFRRKKQ